MLGSEPPVALHHGPLDRELLALDRRPGRSLARVRPAIRASWARCAAQGLQVEDFDVPVGGAFDDESPLMSAARPVLGAIWAHLADEPVSIMLCDETGLVLSRECGDRAVLRSLDEVALAPGSTYSEPAVGTNGFGLALTDDRLTLVTGDEHYSSKLMGYTCAGSPIHDLAAGAVIGALSLTTWSSAGTGLLLALAVQTSANIEAHVAYQGRTQRGDRRPRLTRFEVIERDAIALALERNPDSVADAANDLGISRATIYRRIKHYGIRSHLFVARQGKSTKK
ncbi:MAG TPA: helix-turn-helix domain-containing protein [Coriobacteriia bacterium]|nr:helix-turn-helix domain-containing protein [Coriobacteriia bacterium]